MKTVKRRVPLNNIRFLPEGKSSIIRIFKQKGYVLCELDVNWVQHKIGKYERLMDYGR